MRIRRGLTVEFSAETGTELKGEHRTHQNTELRHSPLVKIGLQDKLNSFFFFFFNFLY